MLVAQTEEWTKMINKQVEGEIGIYERQAEAVSDQSYSHAQ